MYQLKWEGLAATGVVVLGFHGLRGCVGTEVFNCHENSTASSAVAQDSTGLWPSDPGDPREYSMEKELGKNWPTLMRQSRTVNPTVSTVWAESNIGPLLPSDWHCHNPHGIVCVPSSYLETFRSPLGSGISLCYGKLFSLNILNSIFSKSLKTFWGPSVKYTWFLYKLYLFLVL